MISDTSSELDIQESKRESTITNLQPCIGYDLSQQLNLKTPFKYDDDYSELSNENKNAFPEKQQVGMQVMLTPAYKAYSKNSFTLPGLDQFLTLAKRAKDF